MALRWVLPFEMMFLAESGLVQEGQSGCLGALAIYHFWQWHHQGVVRCALQPKRFDVHFKRKVAVAGPEKFHAEFVASAEGQMYLHRDVRCKIRRAGWKIMSEVVAFQDCETEQKVLVAPFLTHPTTDTLPARILV